MFAEQPFGSRPRLSDNTISCRECGDTEWVEVLDGETGLTVRPCSSCNAKMYGQWLQNFPDDGKKTRNRGALLRPHSLREPRVVPPPVQEPIDYEEEAF